MRAIAFYGESPSQLAGAFTQFGDISRPYFRGIPRHLKKVFSICLLPETQKTPIKTQATVSMPGGGFLDRLVAIKSHLGIDAGTSHIWNTHGGSRLVLRLYAPSRRRP